MAEELLKREQRNQGIEVPAHEHAKIGAISIVADQVEEVDVSRLGFGLSPRDETPDQQHINTLVELFSRLPPIVVHEPSMDVIDGVHRVLAARALGRSTIRAVLFHGSRAEAFIFAVRTNIAHGKPLTLREREAAAATVLHQQPEWSDRRLAEVCGLSPTTVGRIRDLQERVTSPPRTRIGRDGKARPVDAIALRRRVADTLRAFPAASNREIASRAGASEGTVRDVRARLREGRSIARALEPVPQSNGVPPAVARQTGPASGGDDRAYVSSEAGPRFADWFDAHLVTDDAEWEPFVAGVPISRVFELADAARKCAESWLRLASAVEARARR